MKSKRIISIMLLMALLLTNISTVFAGNNATLPSNPSTGKGTDDWKYATDWEGVRISLYWAESKEAFKRGEVLQIGETKDFTKTGPRYKIDEYTNYSIFEYMNRDDEGQGKSYKKRFDKTDPYYFVGKEDSNIVKTMPKVWNGTKAEWDNWIEGNDYENIEEISRLLGEQITSEDFIRGTLPVDGYQVKSKGYYKLFVEPIIFPVVAGKGMVLTLRDAIRWTEAFNRGEITPPRMKGKSGNWYTPSLTMNLLPIFEYLANSQFLIEEEAALSMTANSSNYRVDGSTGSSARRAEVEREIKKGGKVYNSMGVGVFTSPNLVVEENASLVITYVKVVGVNEDGSLKYEQIRETEVIEAELDELSRVQNISFINDIEEGTAYLNDIIISPKNLSEEGEVKWDKELPEGLELTAEDIWLYNFGRLTGLYKEIQKDMSSEEYKENKEIIEETDRIIKKGEEATKVDIDKLVNNFTKLIKNIGSKILNIVLDTKAAVEGVVIEIENPKSSQGEIVIEETNKKGNKDVEVKRSTGYLRYVVYPSRVEIIFEETYKDDKLINTVIKESKIPVVEGSDTVVMTDKTKEGFKFIEYKTSKELLNKMPLNPLKKGTTYKTLKGIDFDENIYVRWRKDITTVPATAENVVEEWRLSKLTELDYDSQAYMSLNLHSSSGHASESLSPEGVYEYNTVNPSGKLSKNDINSMKYKDWLHSKAKTRGDYKVTLNNSSVYVDLSGDVNYIKSTDLAGYKTANWVNNKNLDDYDITSANKGQKYVGNELIRKQETLKYGIQNKRGYIHTYSVYHHYPYTYTKSDGTPSTIMLCGCYNQSSGVSASYSTADYDIEVDFERYKAENTDNRLYNLTNKIEKIENGKTVLNKQEETVLNVYPEVAMLFQNNDGNEEVVYVAGEEVRKIQPVVYHTLEHKADIKLKAQGMSVATTQKARPQANLAGLGNKGVVHKGSAITISSEIRKEKGSNERGQLVVKTYALDISDKVKDNWGNSTYNTSIINNKFLEQYGKQNNGKWVFQAEARENLEVGNVYEGPSKVKQIQYKEKGRTTKEYKLEIRGGKLVKVDGVALDTIRTSNKELYEALEGMMLVGQDAVLNTFEHQKGKALTESKFKELARAVKGVDNLEIGKGWYSEDTTVLVVREHTTVLELPNEGFSDKLPMSIRSLETPINKNEYYSKIEKGYSKVRYSVKGKGIEAYIEHSTKAGEHGDKEVLYGVPNVSITDTTGFF